MTLVKKRLLSFGALVLAGCALGYVAVMQSDHLDEKAKADKTKTQLFNIADAGSIRVLRLTTPKGRIVVERDESAKGEVWMVTEPIRTRADSVAVNGIVEQLAQLQHTVVVQTDSVRSNEGPAKPAVASVAKNTENAGGNNEELAVFGLAPARFTVTLVEKSGHESTLEVGKRSSFDGSLFVRRDRASNVLVVPGSLEYQLDKELFDLRDKRLVSFEPNEVTKLSVKSEGKATYTVVKEGERYKLSEPIAVAADNETVSMLLSALTTSNAKNFVAEKTTADEMRRFGLERPQLDLAIELSVGSPLRLLIGEVRNGDGDKAVRTYYATLAGGAGPVVELSSNWLVEKVAVSADSLRDKRVLPFEREQVARLVLRKGETSLTFERKNDGDNHSWAITKPAAAKVQDAALTGIIYRLAKLKAKRIHSEVATASDKQAKKLDNPALVVELFATNGTAIGSLSFGATEGDEQFASGSPGDRIDVVEKSFADEISLDPASYKETETGQGS